MLFAREWGRAYVMSRPIGICVALCYFVKLEVILVPTLIKSAPHIGIN